MITHALQYIKKGKSVMPLRKDKRPYLNEWREFQNRVATEAEVREWWTKWPDANIGLITGKVSGVTVIDVDLRHGGTVDGLPMTLIAKTGNGGWHYYYKYEPGSTIGVNIRPGIDFRNDGGYVVAPPSVTDYINKQGIKEGGEYEYTWKQELENFPIDIFSLGKKKTDWESVLKGVPDGQRNQTATSVAGKLIGALKKEEYETVAWPMLKAWNKNNTPPDDEATLRRTFESIVKKHLSGLVVAPDNLELVNLWKIEDEGIDTRYSTGFSKLDRVMIDDDLIGSSEQGGLALGEFVAIGGRPKSGKTLLTAQIGASLSNAGMRILWLFYEGKTKKLKKILERVGANKDFISSISFKKGEERDSRIEWIEEKLKAGVEQGVNVLVIDNLDFLETGEKVNGEYESLKLIVKKLARMAVRYNVIVILIAHVRKPINSAGDARRPRMFDIAGTSQVERLCDFGIIVDREQIGDKYSDQTKIYLESNRPSGERELLTCAYQNGKLIPTDGKQIDYARQIGLII